MERVRSGIVSKALGISTDGLRKQRQRGKSKYNYEVVDGRVFYDLNSFSPSVRSHIEKLTTKRTKQKHDDIKSPRYWNSIGRINERRIKDKKRRIEAEVQERLAEERAEQYHNNGPLKKRVYAKWVDPHTVGNWWDSIEAYENSKKKKTFKGYY